MKVIFSFHHLHLSGNETDKNLILYMYFCHTHKANKFLIKSNLPLKENAVFRLHGTVPTMPPQLSEAIVCQWANQSPRQLFPCKSSPLWLRYCTSVTLLQYSWEISISYWPKIASVVSFHLLSGPCWRSDLLWDLQSIPQNASECSDGKLAVVTGKHPFSVHLGIFNYSSIWTFNQFNV